MKLPLVLIVSFQLRLKTRPFLIIIIYKELVLLQGHQLRSLAHVSQMQLSVERKLVRRVEKSKQEKGAGRKKGILQNIGKCTKEMILKALYIA